MIGSLIDMSPPLVDARPARATAFPRIKFPRPFNNPHGSSYWISRDGLLHHPSFHEPSRKTGAILLQYDNELTLTF